MRYLSRKMRDTLRVRSVIPIARFARLLSRKMRGFFLFYLRSVTSTTGCISNVAYDKIAWHRCCAGPFSRTAPLLPSCVQSVTLQTEPSAAVAGNTKPTCVGVLG